ncbi:MAG: dihydropteroate synthase [Verrucomicrobia bacterium]|nr:dihydropteroate synthase [Verrucomicrobiota bacterium]
MGILNVTPDSFADGGRYATQEAAIRRAEEMIEEGADIIDLGGESTRPNSAPVSEEEELRRVMPVLERIVGLGAPISIDTRKPAVARRALEAGAAIVNDVGANREDEAMWEAVAEHGAGYICMHMKGDPQTMQKNPRYEDVVAEVSRFFEERMEKLAAAGVGPEQTALDVGVGFGKTPRHNFQLLAAQNHFIKRHNRPLVVGASRKSFLGWLLNAPVEERLAGSLACVCWAVWSGSRIVRVHDVQATCHAARVIEALMREQRR